MTIGIKPALIVLTLALAAPLAANAQTAGAQAAGAQVAGDPARGADLVKRRCSTCHSLVVDTGPRPAPTMKGLAGRKAASVAKFSYSPALKKSGIVWTKEKLNQFLANPSKLVPGTFMAVALPNTKERADVVAYLSTLN